MPRGRTRSHAARRAATRRAGIAAVVSLAGVALNLGPASSSAAATSAPGIVASPAAAVDPLIGTAGAVNTFPGADDPFGMVQWSPDTTSRPPGGGYLYSDTAISGFSLTHISGPGCAAYGDVPFLPTVGAVGSTPGSQTQPFDHAHEHAAPGYYEAQLAPGTAGAIDSELTVTPRTGLGRFTYPASTAANLIMNVGGSASGNSNTNATVVGNHEVTGSATSGNFCGSSASTGGGDSYTIYFDVQFSQPFTSFGTWNGSTVTAGSTSMTAGGANSGAWVTFDTTTAQSVLARVGVSFVSVANAQLNLAAEDPSPDFAAAHAASAQQWNQILSTVQIGGGTATQQKIFYTALYHSLLHPNLFSDVNNQYMGFDNAVHTMPAGHAQYANYSGWDIYRSEAQLIGLLAPAQASDMAQSMVNDYAQSGQLPKWSLANGESYVMVGDPADPIIADFYAFGAHSFDTAGALAAMLHEADTPGQIRPGLDYYKTLHYLPSDGTYGCCNSYGPVSTTLEFTSADFSISTFAAALGDTTNATRMATRSQNWQYLMDSANAGFEKPKQMNGQFMTHFDPDGNTYYVEGNPYQYVWMVPHNIHALIDALGGNVAVINRLDGFFSNLNAGPNLPYSWSGNEPVLESSWEYDYAGAPYRTQDVVRRIVNQLFTDQPVGEAGNDDLGQMSSWYVWAALGMYPEVPGDATLTLGSPLFPTEIVHLPGSAAITINAPQASATTPYVQSLSVNGVASNNSWLPASTITTGATLDYVLGNTPNTSWASAASSVPPSYTTGEAPALLFTDPTSQVTMAPASSATVNFSARNVTDSPQTVTWSTAVTSTQTGAPAGLPTVTPPSGTLTVPANSTATQTVVVNSIAAGTYNVTFTGTAGGVSLIPYILGVNVAGALTVGVPDPAIDQYFNNTGIASNADPYTQANFDYQSNAFSQEAMTAAGLAPGASVTTGGITYQWPNVAASEPDNVVASGQTVTVPQKSGQLQLGVLGASTGMPGGLSGPATVNYTDGTEQQFTLGLSDWTLGGTQPGFGNSIAATMQTRDGILEGCITTNACGAIVHPDGIPSYIFSSVVAVDPSRTVASLTLPSGNGIGQMHIFAVATSATAPSVNVPDAPWAPALPLAGLAAWAVVRRRRCAVRGN